MNFNNKVAIVTGSASGIGKAICKVLLSIGMKVCACDINESGLKQFLEQTPDHLVSNVMIVQCDVSIVEELRGAFEKAKKQFGRLDVIINNAGILNEIHWRKVVEVNFVGVIHGIHLGFEFLDKNKNGTGGYIINTASRAGLEAAPLMPIYCGTKHAIVGLTKSYGQPYYYEKTGVTVNAVCPDCVDTDMFHSFPSRVQRHEEATKMVLNGKHIDPSDVAKAVVQLLQDGKNGALLRVDQSGNYYKD